jgi:hypothetical protein
MKHSSGQQLVNPQINNMGEMSGQELSYCPLAALLYQAETKYIHSTCIQVVGLRIRIRWELCIHSGYKDKEKRRIKSSVYQTFSFFKFYKSIKAKTVVSRVVDPD